MCRILSVLAILLYHCTISAQEIPSEREERLNWIADQLYTVEDFRQRLGGALDGNKDFNINSTDTDFMKAVMESARERSYTEYVIAVRRMFEEEWSDEELKQLADLLVSPQGELVKKLFLEDHRYVEYFFHMHSYDLVKVGLQALRSRDSLRFYTTFERDLSQEMQGEYFDVVGNDIPLHIVRKGEIQTEMTPADTLVTRIEWLSNNRYKVIGINSTANDDWGDPIVTVYEVDGNVYRYVFQTSDAQYGRGKMTKRELLPVPEETARFQRRLNEQYSDPEHSPLSRPQIQRFNTIGGHRFFPANEKYRVEADLVVFDKPELIQMPTSAGTIANYYVYGRADFTLDGKSHHLLIYRNQESMMSIDYSDHLFLPFRDLTAGDETYGGGKYLDLQIPMNPDKIILDFNKSYQPYCAYAEGYQCPIPPEENRLDTRIEAGVKHIDLKE